MNNGFRFLLLLLIVLYGCNPKETDKNTSPTNDSIQKYLALAGNDTLPFDKRIKYNDKALSFVDLERNDSINRNSLYIISFRYHLLNKKEETKKMAEELLKLSTIAKDTLRTGLAYRTLGLYYTSISENEKAIECLFKAKKIFYQINNIDYVIKTMQDIATTQSFACDYLGSNSTLFKELSLAKKLGEKRYYYSIEKLIANNLSSLKHYDKALKLYSKPIFKNLDTHQSNSISLTKAYCYVDLKKYDSAVYHLKKVLQKKEHKITNPINYGKCLSLFALCKTEKNDFNDLPYLFFLADSILTYSNTDTGSNYNQIYLSKYYAKVNDTTKAISAAGNAVMISKSYKNPDDILMSLNQLIKVDKKNASTHAEQYIRINDSLQIAERNFRDKFAGVAYETKEIAKQKNIALKQRSIVMAVAFTLFLISILIFIIARQRIKQKELRLQQTEQKANEEIYQLMLTHETKEEKARQKEKKRIGLELHDGIMNKLVSTRLNLSILSISRDEATVKKCLGYIKDIQNIEKEIRNVAHDLNQEVLLDSNSFSKLLQGLIKDHNKTSHTNFKMEVETDIDWNIISNNKKMNLYRIIQEASHNINKHAKAKNATLKITKEATTISLSITDDGIGFTDSSSENGIGLKNMKYRVKLLKGKFKIHSKSDSGTSINITIPLKEH